MASSPPTSRDDKHPYVDLFSDYYDGELSDDERIAFEQELATNNALRAEYESFEKSLDLLHSLEFNFAPESFVTDVTRDINRQSRGAFFRDGWLFNFRIPYEIFAAVLLAVFGALYLFGLQSERGYEVSDPPDDMPTIDRLDDPRGKALGSATHEYAVQLSPMVDLGVVARGLRNDGFSVRADVRAQADVVLVEVPRKQLDRFVRRALPLVGRDVTDDLSSARASDAEVVTLRLEHAAL